MSEAAYKIDPEPIVDETEAFAENETPEPLVQTVKKRLVFYIPGFDPMPPNRYRELYSAEAAKQAEVCGFEIETHRISTQDGITRFETNSVMDGFETKSEFRFLQWNDLVHREMQEPIVKSWLSMWRVGKVFVGSGALRRLMKLHFPPSIAGLYPFFMITLQVLISFFLGIAVGMEINKIPFMGANIIAVLVGIMIFIAGVHLFRRIDNKLMAYYLLHDLSYSCQENGYTPKTLRERLNRFKSNLYDALDEGYDEVLVVGHSSGAHLAVLLLAEAVRENKIQASHNVSLLSLGHAIPLIAYLPGATDLRLALKELVMQNEVKWVDVTAPSDGACYALHSPVTSSIDVQDPVNLPRTISAAFRQTLSPEYYRRLRLRFFRLHFQYLCHFDLPAVYNYFKITSGPIRLWERFGELNNSPKILNRNYNKFKDEAP